MPVPYYHVVFTLPGPIADIAYQNKAVVYDLLFKVSTETMLTIAADPKHGCSLVGSSALTWIVMSSIMRRRNGLMASSVMGMLLS